MNTSQNSVIGEETPLLQSSGNPSGTPLPWFQFSIVLFLQLTEPLTSHVIQPFAPELVRDSGVTNGNERKVGYYVGILGSVFYLGQAVTVLRWSQLSDTIGRKPVVLCGLFGLFITLCIFGTTTTFSYLMISRCLMGVLNGNTGVIKSMIAELTDSTNITKAYAYVPLSWSTGMGIGPLVGGFLSHPADRFPSLFGKNNFLRAHPYFLPCAVPASLTALVWIIVFLFLKETNPSATSLTLFPWRKPRVDWITEDMIVQNTHGTKEPLSLKSLLTYDVLVTSGNYASVALIDIAFRSVLPVFLSTPILLGGLGLSTPAIGKVLFSIGLLNVIQLFYFARVTKRWGTKNVFMVGLMSTLPAIVFFPVINILARHSGYSFAVFLALGFQIFTFSLVNLCFGTIFIFIAAASPNRSTIGATNGLSQVTVCLMRATGPSMANSLFSLSIEKEYFGGYLVYYVLLLLTIVSIYLGTLLPKRLLLCKQRV